MIEKGLQNFSSLLRKIETEVYFCVIQRIDSIEGGKRGVTVIIIIIIIIIMMMMIMMVVMMMMTTIIFVYWKCNLLSQPSCPWAPISFWSVPRTKCLVHDQMGL